MEKKRCTAVLLAAGKGSRMKSKVAKQFMELDGKPLIYYALETIEKSNIIDDCILVTGEESVEWVKKEIVAKYNFSKVDCVIVGGDERYASVANAMCFIAEEKLKVPNKNGIVFIHDGARPFLTEEILKRTYEATIETGACVAAVPSKDTVKISDEEGFAATTPDRKMVWNVQTPQVFGTELITKAYRTLTEKLTELKAQGILVTDDASVVERFTNHKVKLVEGSYKNIKITTPEDLIVAEAMLKKGKF